ncbi:pentatricopeptide repeat [Trichoderma arundinaceum]|uniref:Pentatricopeptide repeat n=1 Tax=Trichoderma arundinaceum TaxID=490622 RepID=A0A395NTL2_TRIAR|nr:pentatricopeptide repeat [Trichoderma arundinaceum]
MQRSQLLYDGLWRCLCPSFDKLALRTAIHQQSFPRTQLAGWRPRAARVRPMQVRHYEPSVGHISTDESADRDSSTTSPQESEVQQGEDDGSSLTGARSRSWKERLLAPAAPSEETLKASTVEEISAALTSLREAKRWTPNGQEVDQHLRIVQLVQHLLTVENQPITPFFYECLMDAMAHPRGSVDGVRRLLDDMVEQGMKPTLELCNGALRAMMNHPDYVLRQEILSVMQEYWFTIDTSVKQTVAVGLLRDEQYELAYARLTEMIEQGAKIDPWVYDIFILVFGKLGFLDEMLQLLYRRKSIGGSSDALVISLTYYALDMCSQAYHHAGTLFGWLSVVQNHLVQPSDGIIENVLGTAARNADAQLATEALGMMSERTRAQTHHYEAVVEAFAGSGDLAEAIRTLCIMRENGIRISRGHTRTIHKVLRSRPELLAGAEAAVREAARARPVPRAAATVVVESIAEAHGSEKALFLYRDLPKLCSVESPNARMIQELIIHSADEATAKLLGKEYAAQISEDDDPTRSTSTYTRLIARCAEIGEMDLAFRFVKQAMASGITRSRNSKWISVLVEQAITREDSRIWPVVDSLLNTGEEETSKMVRRILQQKRISKLASQWKAATPTTAP